MNIWEYLDERDKRRSARNPRDIRQFVGFMFLAGYYLTVFQFALREVPGANVDLIRDAMLTLGPPVGVIVAAMFRTDARDEQATRNTGIALDAARKGAQAAQAAIGGNEGHSDVLKSGDSITVEKG